MSDSPTLEHLTRRVRAFADANVIELGTPERDCVDP